MSSKLVFKNKEEQEKFEKLKQNSSSKIGNIKKIISYS